MENTFVLDKYIEKMLSSFPSKAIYKSDYITCRCPLCGDSKTNKSKRRGYILKGNSHIDSYVYVCHNGECEANDKGIGILNLFKKYDYQYGTSFFEDYRRENYFQEYSPNFPKYTKNVPEKIILEKDDVKHFQPILKGDSEIFEKAREECIRRKLPENLWKEFFVATGGVFQGRMIIPFYDNLGKIYYYQGRTLIGSDPKYLNRRFGEKEIYGIYRIDRSLPVIIEEGPIDSMFVKNCISILGLKFTEKVRTEIRGLRCFYLLDNDKDGKKNSLKLLKDGKFVFCWERFLKDMNIKEKIKDVNDLVLVTGKLEWCFEDFKKYFTADAFDSDWFL